ncbi:hypothetical protein [Lysobacter enzymogenes]|uniref:hypothetical protein n=1 Tax=Lysobacter enzymogenes TaxID=69 RepID=UPI00099B3C06|nr:hypothetical protein [Lysobacter enzymogenes]UZW61099.1 hypothetical protein BV903_002045 [Lysobacter enzymogenes]
MHPSALARCRPAVAAALALVAIGCSRPPPLLADAAALTQAQRALAALPEFAGRAPQVHAAALFHDDDIEIAIVDPGDARTLHTYRYRQGRWRREDAMGHSCAQWRDALGENNDDLALQRIDFATAARVRANWYERARGVPGALADPDYDRLSGVWFYTRDHRRSVGRGNDGAADSDAPPGGGRGSDEPGSDQRDRVAPGPGERDDGERGQWSTGPISGQGGVGYQIEFGIDGSVRRFERLR